MTRTIALAAILAIAGCTAAHQQQAQTVIAQGQQFCAIATANGPLVVALVNLAGAPVTVTNKLATDVAAACALANGIVVSPPPNPAAAPVRAVPVA